MKKGPAIKFYDWEPATMVGTSTPKKILNEIVSIAENNNIPYQREVVMNCGTDGWSMALSGDGIPSAVISVPERYVHTAVGTVHLDDMEHTITLLVQYILYLDKKYNLK